FFFFFQAEDGIRDLTVTGVQTCALPICPAMRNWKRNAVQKSIGVAKRIFPPHIVPIQLKILMPVGTPTSIVEMAKKVLPTEVMRSEERRVGKECRLGWSP